MKIDEKFGIPAFLAIMAMVLAALMTSSTQYLDVTTFNLLDSGRGEQVVLDYERTIKRDFEGTWRVDLYRDDVWIATARASGLHTYRTTAVLPPKHERDLAWLTFGDPAFENLPCGRYSVAVQWFINPDSMIWRRTVEVRDDFVVTCR